MYTTEFDKPAGSVAAVPDEPAELLEAFEARIAGKVYRDPTFYDIPDVVEHI